MKANELPTEIQEMLAKMRKDIAGKVLNTPYEVRLYNADGTRYFCARRTQASWWDGNGNYLPFGGGSHWSIVYGAIQWCMGKSPLGTTEYRLSYGKHYNKSVNGTNIPKKVATKKEVISIAKAIGIFNI